MLRNVSLVAIYIGVLLVTIGSTQAAQYGTAEEAKAMLGRAIAAVKQDEANALDHFNKGDGGFKDRDLYVLCANASDGIITAHPTRRVGCPSLLGGRASSTKMFIVSKVLMLFV